MLGFDLPAIALSKLIVKRDNNILKIIFISIVDSINRERLVSSDVYDRFELISNATIILIVLSNRWLTIARRKEI